MKKLLYILGFATLGGSLYLYFKKQLDLALNYDFDVKKWKIRKLNTEEVEADIVISLINKSAFEIEVKSYDLNIFYKDIPLARTFSTESFKILSNSSTDVITTTEIEFDAVKKALLPFFLNILQQKAISISVDGYVNVNFLGFNHTINFNKDKFEYSPDIIKQVGLSINNLKEKYPFLKKI